MKNTLGKYLLHEHSLFVLLSKILLASVPLLLLIGVYLHDDPLFVLYVHDDYSITKNTTPEDRDFVSTEVFLKYYPEYKYDSFIFGSSRSLTFLCSEWKKYIHSSCFHYDASAESLYGIDKKINFLDSRNVLIKNCLLILDPRILAKTTNEYEPYLVKHPIISNESWLTFHYIFLTDFLSNKYFVPYLAHKINVTLPPDWGYLDIFFRYKITWNSETNDLTFTEQEKEMLYNYDEYFKRYKYAFDAVDSSREGYSDRIINENQFQQLKEIKDIFDKHKTAYKIIIYGAYFKDKIDRLDATILRTIYGESNVYDFTGVNEYNIYRDNFYDPNHARVIVGDSILKEIYAP